MNQIILIYFQRNTGEDQNVTHKHHQINLFSIFKDIRIEKEFKKAISYNSAILLIIIEALLKIQTDKIYKIQINKLEI
jgi:hypothetical protein